MEIAKEIHLPLIINQNRYNIFDRTVEENGLKDYVHEAGMGLICFSPLAQGMLSEKYINGIPADSRVAIDGRFLHASDITPEKIEKIKKLDALAKERGQSLPQMALSWLLKDNDVTSVLIGASLLMSLESVFAALSGWLILHEHLSARELFGCVLVFVAIILAQLPEKMAVGKKEQEMVEK